MNIMPSDPFADLKTLDSVATGALPDDIDAPWGDQEPEVQGVEVDTALRLSADRSHFRLPTARTFEDYRANPDAFRHMKRLPKPGESHHGVICGKYALADLVWAVMERTGKAIEHLHIATLSYNAKNAADILAAVDAGKIKRISLLISHYFKSTSPHLYDALVPQLLARGHRVLAMRNHSKILLFHMTGGAKYVVESSANLRSCVNVETFVMTNDRRLYHFHAGWIDGELIGGHYAPRT